MQPLDIDALEQAAWHEFVLRLAHQLAGLWPAMEDLLGDRYAVFVKLAVEQAGKLGLRQAVGVARYVNLCFVWGPSFQDKPGFEWVAAALAKAAEHEFLSVHQLVQASLAELQRLPDSKVEPQALSSADAALVKVFESYGRRGEMLIKPAEPRQLPLLACDLEAVELRLLETAVDDKASGHEYRLASHGWHRVKLDTPAALRVDASRPLPSLIAVLSAMKGQGRAAKLQLCARSHAVCHGDRHPALAFSGPLYRWDWAGHETRTLSWPVDAREQAASPPGPACLMGELTSPELYKLELSVCGLRDQGEALGSMTTLVYVWPAAQWWMELQRARPEPGQLQALLPGPKAWQRGVTRCRLERDGDAQDAAALQQQFEQGLDAAAAQGLQKLAAAWAATPGLSDARFDASLGLLVGKMSGTWGWRLGAAGLDGPALMRVLAQLELDACLAELALSGQLTLADSHTRIGLRCQGQAPMQQQISHQAASDPALSKTLLEGVVSWRFPFELHLEPQARDEACLLEQAGPLSGALVGEAGLRPNSKGGSGWEWFLGLRIEALSARLQWTDPLLGIMRLEQPLLPDLVLLDWSLG